MADAAADPVAEAVAEASAARSSQTIVKKLPRPPQLRRCKTEDGVKEPARKRPAPKKMPAQEPPSKAPKMERAKKEISDPSDSVDELSDWTPPAAPEEPAQSSKVVPPRRDAGWKATPPSTPPWRGPPSHEAEAPAAPASSRVPAAHRAPSLRPRELRLPSAGRAVPPRRVWRGAASAPAAPAAAPTPAPSQPPSAEAQKLKQLLDLLQQVAGQEPKRGKAHALADTYVEVEELWFGQSTVSQSFENPRHGTVYSLAETVQSQDSAGLVWYKSSRWLKSLAPLVVVLKAGTKMVVKGNRRLKAAKLLKQHLDCKLYLTCHCYNLEHRAAEAPATVLALYALSPSPHQDVTVT